MEHSTLDQDGQGPDLDPGLSGPAFVGHRDYGGSASTKGGEWVAAMRTGLGDGGNIRRRVSVRASPHHPGLVPIFRSRPYSNDENTGREG
ncbi:hypothetical protein GGTG_09417 [Gaeumannomyces tritici R3-111a-1]|uniref:Uncharacterized protein n=1 Tax=Gaeumannomyces tritici (strain R3-111a-1) TaxID=644352 RepID=J3P7C4_GAET3|nr:hypothetical protein GGTG_09417 [Gaeumannomyces tritici R3-111a-1]EJT72555.1 hypothetical protein GGTG_09417 [Gaeumannomyces tritici R3-111a-1]